MQSRALSTEAAPAKLRDHIAELERAEIERAIAESRGNRSAAAKRLGITRNGLALKLRRLGISTRSS
jgi:DNA-binding NtrC family response regulator